MNIEQINCKSLEKVLKLMQKYQVETLKLHPDGTIEITKKLHAVPASKSVRKPIINKVPSIEELINATPNIAPKVSDFTRYTAAHILPQD